MEQYVVVEVCRNIGWIRLPNPSQSRPDSTIAADIAGAFVEHFTTPSCDINASGFYNHLYSPDDRVDRNHHQAFSIKRVRILQIFQWTFHFVFGFL